jgi:transposase
MDIDKDSAFGRLEIVETGCRRRLSAVAKERIVLESKVGPRQIAATARRHGIARSLLVIWRRAFQVRQGLQAAPVGNSAMSGFVPGVLIPQASPSLHAEPAPGRTEIMLVSGRRIIVEGALDADAVLTLARGLEAIR